MKDRNAIAKSHHPNSNQGGHAHRNALFCLSENTVSGVDSLKRAKNKFKLKLSNAPVVFIPYYTSSIITIGAPSPRRGPSFMIRV